MERRPPQEPDGQGAGDAGRPARDRASDRRGHQHQHHAAVLAKGLCARSPRPISRAWKNTSPAAAIPPMSRASPASSSAASTPRSTRSSTKRSRTRTTRPRRSGSPRSRARSPSPMPSSPIRNTSGCFRARAGRGSRPRAPRPQRLLWASTGTKNKDYSDVLYVEELIGPNTVNTVPPATLDAFRDHGKLRDSLEENVEDARARARRARDDPASRSMRSPPSWSRTASSCSPTPPTSSTARSRTSAPPCSARASTGSSFRSAASSARRSRRRPRSGAPPARSAGSGRTTSRSGPAPTRTSGSAGWTAPASADIADYEDFARA